MNQFYHIILFTSDSFNGLIKKPIRKWLQTEHIFYRWNSSEFQNQHNREVMKIYNPTKKQIISQTDACINNKKAYYDSHIIS